MGLPSGLKPYAQSAQSGTWLSGADDVDDDALGAFTASLPVP